MAVSTFKLDGIIYAGGVLFGLLVFGETSPVFWWFFNHAGDAGRFTLFDWLGLDAGIVVLGVVVMAVGAFGFAEIMEKMLSPAQARSQSTSRRQESSVARRSVRR